ncbi:MAG: hypothetical protein LUI12_02870 [Clostridiales bacterium]|nr:hypothetical protein [Clostridiales bacterium]
MNQSRILPFYMTYPLPMYYQQEDTVTRDLEYLQQMYPTEAKKYQKIIAEVLDKLDYEGSMIYDEYPDKWQIYRLTQIIVDKIRKQQEAEQAAAAVNASDGAEESQEENDSGQDASYMPDNTPAMDWDWIAEFIQVLLSYEIYKKRHTNRNGILKF